MILFIRKLFFILFLLVFTPSLYLYSQEQGSIEPSSSNINYCSKIFSSQDLLSQVKENGVFKPISLEYKLFLEEAYRKLLNQQGILPIIDNVRHVFDSDLDFILPPNTDPNDVNFHWEAIDSLRNISYMNQDQIDPEDLEILNRYGYKTFSDTYFFTSVGGAWARGGSKTIKFEVPLNIKDLVDVETQKLLIFSDRIFQAKEDIGILLSFVQSFELLPKDKVETILGKHDFEYLKQIISNLEQRGVLNETVTEKHLSEKQLPWDLYNYIHDFAVHCKELLATYVSKLISEVKEKPEAINIVDLKIALTAVLSQITHLYFPIDFWTGQHTHNILKDYLYSFRYDFNHNFATKRYSKDPIINEMIVKSISRYLKASEELGETFLFGYMELVPPIDNALSKIDPMNNIYWQDQQGVIKNSPGASSFFAYLNITGRRDELLNRGIRYLLFNNLEVLGPVHKEIAAFKKILEKNPNYDLAFLVVPKQQGYAGGFPVIEVPTGRKILLEESQVAPEQRENYGYFNTNTGIFKLENILSVEKIGFEKKEQGRISRPKGNLGDATSEYSSALIGGEVGENYLNFKGYGDYVNNGTNLLETYFGRWISILLEQ